MVLIRGGCLKRGGAEERSFAEWVSRSWLPVSIDWLSLQRNWLVFLLASDDCFLITAHFFVTAHFFITVHFVITA